MALEITRFNSSFTGGISTAEIKGALSLGLGMGKSVETCEAKGTLWCELSGGILCFFDKEKGALAGMIAVANCMIGFMDDGTMLSLTAPDFAATLTAESGKTQIFNLFEYYRE